MTLLRRTAVRVVADFVGESCEDQIEEGVRLLVARGVTDGVWAPETTSPERIELVAEAERGSRSRGRRAPRGSSCCWSGSSEVVEVCGGERELRGAIYSRPEAVAANGISPASDYSGAVVGQWD